MITRRLYTALLFLLIAHAGWGQARFFSSIKVEYEKTTSVRQLMKDLFKGDSWFEQFKDQVPVSTVKYFDFTGDTSHSIYKPGREVKAAPNMFWQPMAEQNTVYNDYHSGRTITQKPVFEETFLLEDSMLRIRWKITGDIRNIGGYDCRKAVGIINDSIAVFAFYSDELLINGGPEGIHGLPGMILGMGIPRLHATWFATKIEVFDVNMKPVTPPTKGKKVSREELMTKLTKLAENWGNFGSKMLVNFVI